MTTVRAAKHDHKGGRAAPATATLAEPEAIPTPIFALQFENPRTGLHFQRSHFGIPSQTAGPWSLAVGGLVRRPLSLSPEAIRLRRQDTVTAVLECAGHRRAEFVPHVAGIQWGVGAICEAAWTGIPLADLLAEAEPLPGAREVVLYGADCGRYGARPDLVPFARSLPLAAVDAYPGVLLATHMNGEPLPAVHGAPLRAVVPNRYAVDSVKWLCRVEVVDESFDGPFQAHDYLLRTGPEDEGREIGPLRINSLITSPRENEALTTGEQTIRGIAWGGAGGPAVVEISVNGGPWRAATLERREAYRRSFWTARWRPRPGRHTIAARATDQDGVRQPTDPVWNLRGYANNSTHRVAVDVRNPSPKRR